MITIDVSSGSRKMPMKEYYKYVEAWKYESFKDAVLSAIKVTDECHSLEYGICILFIAKYTDSMSSPTHHYKYYNQFGDVISSEYFDEDLGHVCEHSIQHHVDWTKNLGLEYNHRLQFVYTSYEYSEEEVQQYIALLENDAPLVRECKALDL